MILVAKGEEGIGTSRISGLGKGEDQSWQTDLLDSFLHSPQTKNCFNIFKWLEKVKSKEE